MKIVNDFLVGAHIKLTVNVGEETLIPYYIVLHYDAANNPHSAISWMLNPASQVSAHLHISRYGVVTQLASFAKKCWHAGISSWDGLTDLNTYSIGIELQNDGYEPYPLIQLSTLRSIGETLVATYPIKEILGHSDISPGRKIDPGKHFPMHEFKSLVKSEKNIDK